MPDASLSSFSFASPEGSGEILKSRLLLIFRRRVSVCSGIGSHDFHFEEKPKTGLEIQGNTAKTVWLELRLEFSVCG